MVDDDVLLLDIDEAVLSRCVPLQAVLDHGDLSQDHKLRHDLAEEDSCVRVLIDLVPFGDRFDEITLGTPGEPISGLPRLGPADVEVVRVPIATYVGYGHGGTSNWLSRWTRFSLTRVVSLIDGYA